VNVQELVSIISASGGVLIGLAGIGVSYSSARGQRLTAVHVAKEQAKNSAAMAERERHQRRLEKAYSDLLEWITKCDDLLSGTQMEMIYTEDPDDWSSGRELAILIVTDKPMSIKRDSFLWSGLVSEHVNSFTSHAFLCFNSAAEYGALRRDGVDVDKNSYADLLQDRMQQEVEAGHKQVELLRRQIRLELVGEEPSSPA
jgi:hypothetical protein